MKNTFLITLSFILFSCVNNSNQTKENEKVSQTDSVKTQEPAKRRSQLFRRETVHFFGQTVDLGDSAQVMNQIKAIAENDAMLSVDDDVLTICNVGFGISIYTGSLSLLSSVTAEDPKIKPIVEYINGFYGTAYESEPDSYWWYVKTSPDDDYYTTLVMRLRRLHTEEGGTVIFFY